MRSRLVHRHLLPSLLCLGAFGWSSHALATARVWDGSVSTSWNVADNWTPSGVPVAGDDVTFNSTYNQPCIVNENVRVRDFTVSSGRMSSATITHANPPVGHGGYMIVTGDFTLASDAKFTAPAHHLFIGGKISIGGSGAFTRSSTGTVVLAATATPSSSVFGSATFNNLVIADALPVTTGLISHWKLDDTANTNAADSGSGAPNALTAAGTLTNNLQQAPLAGTGTCFNYGDAINGNGHARATMGTSLNTNTWSLSAWARIDNVDDDLAGDSKCSDLVNIGGNYWLSICQPSGAGTSGVAKVEMYPATGNLTCSSAASININSGQPGEDMWTHVVGTNDGSRLTVYLDGVKTVCADHNTTTPTTGTYIALGGAGYGAVTGANTRQHDGRLDDVRAYNRALTDAEALALYTGAVQTAATVSHASTGDATVAGRLWLGSGTFAPAGNLTVTGVASIVGDFTHGGLTATFNGGLNLEDLGRLTFSSTSAVLRFPSNGVFNMDGTLVSATGSGGSKPTIQSVSGTYAFRVGSVASATPVLDVDGLYVRDTDAEGLFINKIAGSVTTFTRFDNVTFTHGADGASNPLLQLAGSSLDFKATGLSFDNSSTSYAETNVKVTDRDLGTPNDVKVVIGGTCVSESDCENDDSDDDATNDGVADNGGGVVYWLKSGHTDHGGAIEGFPVESFNWTDFAYNATYVAYNNVTGSKDRLYKRAADGSQVKKLTAQTDFYYELPSDDDFVGAPRWIQVGSVYYVFVITKLGRIYKLQDTAEGFTVAASYQDGGSATSITPLALDATNVYWLGNSGSASNTTLMFKLTQAALGSRGASTSLGDLTTGNAAPIVGNFSTGSALLFGTSGALYKWDLTNLAVPTSGAQPTSYVFGRLSQGGGVVYFADYRGKVWAVNGNTLTTVAGWPFQDTSAPHSNTICNVDAVPNACSVRNIFFNVLDNHVYFGDYDGHLYAVKGDGTELYSNYPLLLESGSNIFESAPLYRNGIIAIGSRNGNVYFVDRKNGSSQPALLKTVRLGSAVASISFDHSTTSYLIATANGGLYRMGEITDSNGN